MPRSDSGPIEVVSFTARDGVGNALRIAATNQLASDRPDPKQLLLLIPAMGVPARKYDQFIVALARHGITSVVFDLRGHGASTIRPSRSVNFSYCELVEKDLPAAIEATRCRFETSALTLAGHSLGGQVSLLSLANQADDITGVVLLASCSVYYRGWPWLARWPILVFSQACYLAAKLWGYFPGHLFRFGGNEAQGVMQDWARNARSGNYLLTNSQTNYERSLKLIKRPILAINFRDDRMAPTSATRQLVAKLHSDSSIIFKQLDRRALAAPCADHFMFLRFPDKVAETVAHWLNSHK